MTEHHRPTSPSPNLLVLLLRSAVRTADDAVRELLARDWSPVLARVLAPVEDERARQAVHEAKYAQKGLGLLLDEMTWGAHAEVVAALELGDDDAVDDILQNALTGPAFQEELRGFLAAARLTDANRQQLEDGLDAVMAGRFATAGSLLITGIEGCLWYEARVRGLVVPSRRNKIKLVGPSGATGKTIHGVEDLFDPLNLGTSTTAFLQLQVYGGAGHRYRHGNAEEGWKRCSLMLVVTLVTLLQRMDSIPEPSEPQAVIEPDITNLLVRAFSGHSRW